MPPELRVLVTGVAGFSGVWVARKLARLGHDVTGLYRRCTPNLQWLATQPRVSLIEADLLRAKTLAGPFQAVIHAAATSPAPGVTDAQIVLDNVAGTAALIDAAESWGVEAFVFFSSVSLYGEIRDSVLDEECPVFNPDVYGASKLMAERLLAEHAARLPALALRLPGVIGPGAHRNWLAGVATALRAGATVRAFNLDGPFNNAAHIDDVAQLVARTLRRGWRDFDAVILGARGNIAVRGAIERLAHGLGVHAGIEAVPPPKPAFTLCSERAIARWGYAPMEIGEMIDRYAGEVRSGGLRAEATSC